LRYVLAFVVKLVGILALYWFLVPMFGTVNPRGLLVTAVTITVITFMTGEVFALGIYGPLPTAGFDAAINATALFFDRFFNRGVVISFWSALVVAIAVGLFELIYHIVLQRLQVIKYTPPPEDWTS